MKITLTRLALFNISSTYALNHGDSKITHYSVSFAKHLYTGQSPDDMVKEHVSKEYGVSKEDVEIVTPETPSNLVTEATDVLVGLPEIEKALRKVQSKNMLYQYNKKAKNWFLVWLLKPLSYVLNPIIGRVNQTWFHFQWKVKGGIPTDRFEYLAGMRDLKRIPYLPEGSYIRMVTPCRFLSLKFEEQDRSKAFEIFREDLKKLQKHKVIMGHMAMPFTMRLADVVGSGRHHFALACFLFCDDDKIRKISGDENPCNYPQLPLNSILGLKTESFEGCLTELPELDYNSRYQIEEVYVGGNGQEDAYQEYLKNYEETREAVNKAAEKRSRPINKS